MPDPVRHSIDLLKLNQDLDPELMKQVIMKFMEGKTSDSDIAEFLTLLHRKGETAAELKGAALALREQMLPIESDHANIIDTCGTGGSGISTFNISTATAIVAASAGAIVAKHGNRASTSRSGSSDVLTELGVNVEAEIDVVEKCLNELGICFCFAPLHHSSVRHVMSVRRSLNHPTIFNLTGPLCNPARANRQLLGAGRSGTTGLLASALAELGIERAAVVHSRDGLGEISPGSITDAVWIEMGELQTIEICPSDFHLAPTPVGELLVDSPSHSAEVIRGVLAGQSGAPRHAVLMNAAAVLFVYGTSTTLQAGWEKASRAVDSGASADLLERLIDTTNR